MSYDLYITNESSPVSFSLQSLATDGARKAISQWLVFFMTKRGSVLSDPNYGTTFLKKLSSAGANDLEAVKAIFNVASQELFEWMAENNLNRGSEIIVNSSLLDTKSFGDKIQLTVELQTMDGQNYTLTTPIENI